jgi:hypothetical protein
MLKSQGRGSTPLRKSHADADPRRDKDKLKKAATSRELVSMLTKMSDEEQVLALIKATECLPVQRAMWGLQCVLTKFSPRRTP